MAKEEKKPTILNFLLPLVMVFAGAFHFVKHGLDMIAVIPVIMGALALYMVLFNRPLLRHLEDLIIKLWFPIGQLITIILLSVTFFVIFAPVGLILRLIKKDILKRDINPYRLSYWLDRPKNEQSSYTQQF